MLRNTESICETDFYKWTGSRLLN
uniref:Uncharacterized protein n=1 Tax=Anguilla anguilla TaxID=7936 RepID=A0A0E9T366_ANGAN